MPKKSNFITDSEVPSGYFFDTFGNGVNRKISKENLFAQIQSEVQVYYYDSEDDLKAANLEADPDSPIYVHVAPSWRLYRITSLAPVAPYDIALNNGTTATLDRLENLQFINVQDMKDAPYLKIGDFVEFIGYNTPGDGGGNKCEIGTGFGTADNGSVFDLSGSGLQAKALNINNNFIVQKAGAVGDGITDDTDAIEAAFGANGVIRYRKGTYLDSRDGSFPVYGIEGQVGGEKIRGGEFLTPTSDNSPIFWSEKFSTADRDTDPNLFDAGAVYATLYKKSDGMSPADAYGAAITGYSVTLDGSGDWIGGHFRSQGIEAVDTGSGIVGASAFALWSYADANPPGGTGYVQEIIGHEINLRNRGSNAQKTPPAGVGLYRGLNILTADSGGVCNIGVDVGAQTGTGGWWTGARFRADGIIGDADRGAEESEQILIEGSTLQADHYGGIFFNSGWFEYGIDLSQSSYIANAAIVMGEDKRLLWSGRASSRYVTVSSSDNTLLNLNNLNLAINGTKVVGSRATGFGTASGTTDLTSWNTGTVDLTELAQRVGAIWNVLRTHGLIGD